MHQESPLPCWSSDRWLCLGHTHSDSGQNNNPGKINNSKGNEKIYFSTKYKDACVIAISSQLNFLKYTKQCTIVDCPCPCLHQLPTALFFHYLLKEILLRVPWTCRMLSKTITYSCSNAISIESPVSIMGLDIPLEYSNVVEVHSKEGALYTILYQEPAPLTSSFDISCISRIFLHSGELVVCTLGLNPP